jgi:cytochrome c oxidase subunit I
MVAAMKKQTTLAERWLWLGVSALAVAGVFAVILVVARTPQLAALTIFQKLFSVALVIHVDLSVLMWFIAMLGMGIALLVERHGGDALGWTKTGFYTVAAATLLMAISPIDTQWEVIKSNYIPVLQNHIFLLSLGVLASGLVILLVPLMIHWVRHIKKLNALNSAEQGIVAASFTTVLALVAFFLSADAMPAGLAPEVMYERLFWAGGHILQFSFSVLMMAAWLVLLEALGIAAVSRRVVVLCYGVMVMGAVASLLGFWMHAFDSSEFTEHQTRVMAEWGGAGVSLLAALLIYKTLRSRIARMHRAYGSALVMSLVVFIAGGALGIQISGQNVTIPAHYHGMIVGITLALMGWAYVMLPRFGYASVAQNRMAFLQPIIYGVGQLMHIGGLGYSGGYGVLRKTPGAIADIGMNVKIALGIMGFGGLLAIIGGILFVIVMVRARVTSSASLQPPMV